MPPSSRSSSRRRRLVTRPDALIFLSSSGDNQSVRVLVVEDEPKMAALIRRGLVEEGYAADVAATRRGRALDGAARPSTTRSCST